MDFVFTPEEARSTALRAAAYLAREKLKVSVEVPMNSEAPYATTLLAESAGSSVLIEAVGRPTYAPPLQELVRWLATRREDCELYLAVGEHEEIGVGVLRSLKHDGVGLFIAADDGRLETSIPARNPALMITVDRTLPLGRLKNEVRRMENDFNAGDRKGQLREMCELVERETGTLAATAANHAWVKKSGAEMMAMDWSSQINILASAAQYTTGHAPLVSQPLKDDLQSFRGARNLIDHPVRTRAAEIKRQRQFPERMLMGARLLAELLSLQRRVK